MPQKWKNKIMQKNKELTFYKKVLYFLQAAIIFVSALLLVVSLAVSRNTIVSKSEQMALTHLSSMARYIGSAFEDIEDFNTLIIADSAVQYYLSAPSEYSVQYLRGTNTANNLLGSYGVAKSYTDYAALIKYQSEQVLYRGKEWTHPNFREESLADFNKAKQLGNTRVYYSMSPDFFKKGLYTLHLYQEVHAKYNAGEPLGLLSAGVSEEYIRNLYLSYRGDYPFSLYIVDEVGDVLSSPDASQMLTKAELSSPLVGNSGSFENEKDFTYYQRIEPWGWYLVGTLPRSFLLAEVERVTLLLLLLVVAICLAVSFGARALVRSLYRPLAVLDHHIELVSRGELDARINTTPMPKDMEAIAKGFNAMLEDINLLMEQVKEEQKEVEQIKLHALQSQIKPHFLYNTLECIHWQAAMDGSEKASELVLALANYYHICLSDGEDIIPLKKEIEHIEHYLFIQNMRYDDIIESDLEVDPAFDSIMIPKMTLQPLIENSIYHGIRIKQGQRGKITLTAHQRYEQIILTLSDTGTSLTLPQIQQLNHSLRGEADRMGYGVRNVHRRLEILFGPGHGLWYSRSPAGGLQVAITLPGSNKKGVADV